MPFIFTYKYLERMKKLLNRFQAPKPKTENEYHPLTLNQINDAYRKRHLTVYNAELMNEIRRIREWK